MTAWRLEKTGCAFAGDAMLEVFHLQYIEVLSCSLSLLSLYWIGL